MIDVQIVTYNSKKNIADCLSALFAQDVPINVQVFDNNSQDCTVKIIQKQFPQVELHTSSTNLGFGKAHNALKGSSPYLLLLNPDAYLMDGALATLIEAAEKSPSEVAAWEARQFPYEHPKVYDPVSLETDWVSGACVLLKRSAFEEVRGFDPNIFLYGEDVDLSFRLRNLGYKLHYCPRAKVEHVTHATPPKHTYLGSTLANLYLRTRFGSHFEILKGLLLYFVLARRYPFAMGKNLFTYFRNFFSFYKTRQRKIKPKFSFLDYTDMRLGAFYAQKTPDQTPKVSVLIRTTGNKKCLHDALKCLENQTYSNIEIILIEDGPPTIKPSPNICYKALGTRRGRSIAGNIAMQQATGEYFVFLDEDDLFFADHIEQLVAAADKVAYSLSFEVPSKIDTPIMEGKKKNKYVKPFCFPSLLDHNYIPILNVLFHRSLYEKEGGFKEELEGNEDWHLWVRYAHHFRPFAFVNKTTALYRVPYSRWEKWRRRFALEKQERIARDDLRLL